MDVVNRSASRAAWTLQERGDLVFAVRKLAEAWWNLAGKIERGDSPISILSALVTLDGVHEQALRQLRGDR